MNKKIKIKETIIVEGKYDRIKLKSIADANIITTNGFKIYNDSEKQALIKNIAKKTGIIIMTDSDAAGRNIRNFIKGCINYNCIEKEGDNKDKNNMKIINIYIPKILGKEKRKTSASKENLLGVEGTDADMLREILNRFGVKDISISEDLKDIEDSNSDNSDNFDNRHIKNNNEKKITKMDFYEDKLIGGKNSSEKREYICGLLDIPYMSTNSLLEAVNILLDYNQYKKIIRKLNELKTD